MSLAGGKGDSIPDLLEGVWGGMVELGLGVLYSEFQCIMENGHMGPTTRMMLYPDSGISMDEEIVLGDMIWSYNKAEL